MTSGGKQFNFRKQMLVLLSRPLGGEQIEPLLDGDPLPGVLVLWGEPAVQISVTLSCPSVPDKAIIYSMNQYHLAGCALKVGFPMGSVLAKVYTRLPSSDM